jgi:hypothetical protein
MRAVACSSVVLGVVIMATAVQSGRAWAAEPSSTEKVFEWRTYKANPGKRDALNARFRDQTCRLFKKHSIEIIGFWMPIEGEEAKDMLYYLVSFPSVEAQKQAWKAFFDDPEWKKVRADSEKDGVLVKEMSRKNLKATDYSPLQ